MNPTAPDPARRLAVKRAIIISVCLVAVYITGVSILIGSFMNSFFAAERTVIATRLWDRSNIEATLVKTEAGATVSTSYAVMLGKPGSKKKEKVIAIVRVSEPELLKIEWTDEGLHVTLPPDYQSFERLYSVKLGRDIVPIKYEELSKERELATP